MLKDLCFEIIETCPNNCLFCSSCSSINKEKLIEYKKFKEVIDYFMSIGGIEEISLSGGEPLLHPELLRMIRYCKLNNIKTVLFTSGIKKRFKMSESDREQLEFNLRKSYKSYLSEGMPKDEYEKLISKQMSIYLSYDEKKYDHLSTYDCKLLKGNGLDKIVFDFEARDRNIYDKIMGTKDLFDLVTLSMIKAKSSGLNTDAHFIPTKINYKELEDIIEMLNVAEFDELSILNFVPQGRGKINEDLLNTLTTKAIELYQSHTDVLQKPTTSELLAIKGVCETEDVSLSEEETDILVKTLLASFDEACQKLQHDRKEEGEKIRQALLDILQNIAVVVAKIDAFAKTQPEKLKNRLQVQLDLLLDPTNPVSEERLAQEVALYVARADIQEEIDRLKAHILTAQNLLSSNEPVGRRLDFLCQELNREANTTCSKSCDIELTNYGMDLKTLIEQFREQVQNIE